ncbi:protein translocase subunit SecD [Paenibacillus sediminis]|uniref:Protein translocase subunit SecD n=1 Tax=Paenibacillus sediminis TaxID=664909 RepID=A0ABS4GYH2_9BACL|nr:protein translocase subunit SecD [Paenibacillus sediminis]MBP1935157.1 SecD/SecF fusion protein [Paenibacillus sediminis]
MNKRIITFIIIVLVTAGVMGYYSPLLIKSINLGLDLKGGFEILYEASPLDANGKLTKESLQETAKSLEKRANALGTSEPEVTTEGTNRIRLKIAGVTNPDEVRKKMKDPAVLTFRSSEGCKNETDYCKVELLGSDFAENGATIGYNQLNQPEINIKLKNKQKFAEVTSRLVNKHLAIFLDNQMLSDPVVRQPLTDGTATISGDYTLDEAKELRDTINLGALPLKLTEKYSQSVGATLGKLSLHQTLMAGLIGSALILLFMIVMYLVPGLIASFSIVVYSFLVLVIFKLAGVTLTLPGIAAFILGIGMAVDANIITYERIKEEMLSGKSVLSAVKAGSKSSFRTIMDANITTILAGAVMFMMGTGSVKGFALVLIINIIISVATNIFFSRFLLTLLVKGNAINKPIYFGVKESDIRAL